MMVPIRERLEAAYARGERRCACHMKSTIWVGWQRSANSEVATAGGESKGPAIRSCASVSSALG